MSSEIIADADHKMARAVEAMERDFQGIRTGRASTSLVERIHVDYYGTSDAAQPAGRDQRSRAAPDRHPAVGPGRPRRDREGDHQERHRPDAERRRHRRPPQHPAAHRGASQGHRQGRPQADGGGQGRDPQPAPRRGRRASRRRSATATVGTDEAHRQLETLQKHDRSLHRRGRPGRRRQGTGGPRGLVARVPLARPTDAPPVGARPDGRRSDTRAPRPRRPDEPLVPPEDLPRHVAIIMDGNRRWAAAARPARARGPRRRRRGDPRPPPSRRPARRPGPDPVRVQPRELGPLRRRGHRPVRPPRGGDPERDRRAPPRRASGSASSAGSTSCPTRPALDRRRPRGNRRRRPAAPQHRLQLRGPDRARRRRPPARRERHRAGRDRRGRHLRRRSTRPACPTPTSSSGPAASSASRTSSSGSRPTPSSTSCDALWPDFGPDAFDAALLEFASRTAASVADQR